MKIGGYYNWIGQPERLIYLGKDRNWHQFKKIGDDREVWCDVLESNLSMIEETPQPAYPDPTPEMLDGDVLFDAIWGAIKGWDISRLNDGLYSGPSGNDARHVYDAIKLAQTEPTADLVTQYNVDASVARIFDAITKQLFGGSVGNTDVADVVRAEIIAAAMSPVLSKESK